MKRAFTALFRQEGWVKTLLLGTLCMIVPVLGQIVAQGYGARIMKAVAFEDGDRLPPLEGVKGYLKEGMLPFMAALLWTVPITLVYYGAVLAALAVGAGGMFVGMALDLPRTASILIGALPATLLFMIGVLATVLMARHWHAADTLVEVTGKLEYAWKLGAIRSYLKVLGNEGRLAYLRSILGNLVAVLVGTLLFGMGVVFAPFVMMVASAHLQGQLYRRYLEMGGEPYPRDTR
ncbi:MAG: DUF4013 domain-containing protein [Deltaproteobacteria bacterium]|nr:DUF4013 domain-containing protein [Deltaproteobacteria bacterium]